eukprot:scaffold71751_cov63-Phaeocystis_antarctica.AAC.3
MRPRRALWPLDALLADPFAHTSHCHWTLDTGRATALDYAHGPATHRARKALVHQCHRDDDAAVAHLAASAREVERERERHGQRAHRLQHLHGRRGADEHEQLVDVGRVEAEPVEPEVRRAHQRRRARRGDAVRHAAPHRDAGVEAVQQAMLVQQVLPLLHAVEEPDERRRAAHPGLLVVGREGVDWEAPTREPG